MDYTDVRNISVRLHWDSWKSAHVALDDLQDAHWLQPPGAPRELLHALRRLRPHSRGRSPA